MSVVLGLAVGVLYLLIAWVVGQQVAAIDTQPDNPIPITMAVVVVAFWPVGFPGMLLALGVLDLERMKRGDA